MVDEPPVNSVRTREIRDRTTGPVIALGERLSRMSDRRGRAGPLAALGYVTPRDTAALSGVPSSGLAAAVIGFAGPGDRGIAGPLKGADFVHFYTLGHLAESQQVGTLLGHESPARCAGRARARVHARLLPHRVSAAGGAPVQAVQRMGYIGRRCSRPGTC